MTTIWRSKSPQVLGFVSMIAATSGARAALTASMLTFPSSLAGTERTEKPMSAAVAGLVPCAESGTSTMRLRFALSARLDSRLDRHHAAKLAVRAGFGRHCDRAHSGHRHQGVGKRFDDRQCALRGRNGLERMNIGKARQTGHLLIEARVVLHRARSEWINAGVDRIVVARQTDVMAHCLGLGEARQIESASARARSQSWTGTMQARRYRRPRRRSGRFQR